MCPGASDVKCCLSGLTFSKLSSCYPQGEAEEVKERIGGAVNGDWITNTCAIRMSHTLNCAGKNVPAVSGQSVRGANNWSYIFRVKQLSPVVKGMFGNGHVIKGSGAGGRGVDNSSIRGKVGIIYFDTTGTWNDASGHFDLWNGSTMVESHHANAETTAKYFSISISVTFWEFQH